ncbi:glycine-rich domain-containing protein [Flavicella sediminum]|uniref:hypothetical protein n=1 Tax=Flavicella sediminum TaxID=2585141 RepID=UPI00111F1617|nr:hypothetical protein [Flavicella sediminum]
MKKLEIQESRDLFEKIKDYDLSKIIERHKKDEKVDTKTAELRAIELKKWLVIAKVNATKKSYKLTGNIDKIWHTFLMFTKDYNNFCKELGGFVHHSPMDTLLLKEAKNNNDLRTQINNTFNNDYSNLLRDYEDVFQMTPHISIWPNVLNPYGAFNDPADPSGGCSDNTCQPNSPGEVG